MASVVRAICIYLILLIVFRIAGKRTLSQITTFDLVLTLIISEAIQQALIDADNSVTNAVVVVTTLVGMDVLLSFAKEKSRKLDDLLDGVPVIVMAEGMMHKEAMERERVQTADILEAAREMHGIARLAEIDYAVVENSGCITIVPKKT